MRVLLCRSREDAEASARRLLAAGHEALIAPVLEIVPLAVALPVKQPDAVVLTSRHAVRLLEEDTATALRDRPAYAVGAATARAARARGFADVRIGPGEAAGLLDLLRLTLPAPARLLYLTGRVHKPDLPDALAAGRYGVTTVEAYDATPAPGWTAEVRAALSGGTVHACLHYSRRSADLALRLATEGDVAAPFLGLLHACLSPEIAQALVEAGAAGVKVAARPDEVSLLQCLARRMA